MRRLIRPIGFTATLGLLLASGLAQAADRTAEQILKDIDEVKAPELDRAKLKDRAYLREYLAKSAEASQKRSELIGELYKVAPDDEKLAVLLPERWRELAPPAQQREQLRAELDAVLAHSKNEKLVVEARFFKAELALLAAADARFDMAPIEAFVKLAPNDPRAPSLLFAAARRTSDESARSALEDRILKDFPESPTAGAIKGSRRRREGVGEPFTLEFTDAVKGGAVSVQDLKGKVVVVDFWATWCGPCVSEMPKMKALYAKYRHKGVEFIGVSLDQPEDQGGLKALKEFVAQHQIEWPQYYQGRFWDGEFSRSWGVDSIPCVFVVDQEGKLHSTEARGELHQIIPRLLGEEAPAADPATPPTGKNVSHFDYWTYEKDDEGRKGFFKKETDKRWIEEKDGRAVATFDEVARTPDFIELYDAGRKMSLRLYDGRIFWKTKDQNEWNLLPFAAIGKER